jgi:ribonuclease HI
MRVTIISDASYCQDSRAAGYGFWIACERGKRGGGGAMRTEVECSNAAEAMALVNSLTVAISYQLVQDGDFVLLQTDSQAAIDAFEGRRHNSMTRGEREAVKLLRQLRSEHSLSVAFRHVKGHTNRAEARYVTNNLCDQRAKAGLREARARVRRERGQ